MTTVDLWTGPKILIWYNNINFCFTDACSEVEPKVNLTKVNRGELTFSWSPLASNCPTVQYNITSTDCGNCTRHTTNTSTTCAITLASTEIRNCTFSVRGELHGFAGRPSSPITVTLKGKI